MQPSDSSSPATPEVTTEQPSGATILAFTIDAETEQALRDGLSDIASKRINFRSAHIRAATAILGKMPSPATVIVDLGEEKNPVVALSELLQVIAPNVQVLVVGDWEGVDFYRQVTRDLGVVEYLHKPLTRDIVARFFGPLLIQEVIQQDRMDGGRLVTVTGVRGGVGASTIAVNLSWFLGVEANRHTVLFDTDLQRGVSTVLLGMMPGSGVRTMLKSNEKIDVSVLERVVQQVCGRLQVLAGNEDLADRINLPLGKAVQLAELLRRRYNFVVVDLPFTGLPLQRDLMDLATQRVLVMLPTLAGIRDMLRLFAIPNSPTQPRRAIVVLNRVGMTGGLELRRIVMSLGMTPDIVIPDFEGAAARAETLGTPFLQESGPFRNAMQALAREVGFNSHVVGNKPAVRPGFWRRK